MLIDLNLLASGESSKISTFEELTISNLITSLESAQPTINVDNDSSQFYVAGSLRKKINGSTTKINQNNRDVLVAVRGFESEIFRLQQAGDCRKAMYRIHEQMLFWKRNNLFTECDLLFQKIDSSRFDLRVLVTLLMASVQIKPRLSYRSNFYNSVLNRAKQELSEADVKLIFTGLI